MSANISWILPIKSTVSNTTAIMAIVTGLPGIM